jgi:hypothetical protein
MKQSSALAIDFADRWNKKHHTGFQPRDLRESSYGMAKMFSKISTGIAVHFLIQIFLPVYDNSGNRFQSSHYMKVRSQLIKKFGGLTAYTRAPAVGLWDSGSAITQDDIIVFEVMAEALNRKWWRGFKRKLELAFRQQEIMIRAQTYETL